jgi:hypothetical protein
MRKERKAVYKAFTKIFAVITLILFWGIIIAEGAEMTPLVHQWIGVNPGGGNNNINVTANGARYRFYVALSLNTDISPNPNGDRFYATDGYVYKRSSITWSVNREGGIPETESEKAGAPKTGNNSLKSFRWQTPIASGAYTVTLSGQRHPYGGGGGGGEEVWDDFTTTRGGTFAYAQVYDTKMIYGDPKVPYGTGTEFAVTPGAKLIVETKVKDNVGDIKYGEVTVYWEKVDPSPANSPGGQEACQRILPKLPMAVGRRK